ncbi:NYN domain-containing protein [Paraburkholderia sp.]|uniref:NYN domain-containing protein n=1 Tax=Paraburkholderia sp. TaxID=1926495 RepID=UPI002390A4A6|nr:NYN domain-containing protein [Paraburkholderia sp.]MDE1183107.1 NYN domain-containing protein [Paraburkholderia sp.]
MASSNDTVSMALFCDFENVALGVRDLKLDKFDIKLVLERLLLKGSIVVKKAYCDWDRYKSFKGTMHEANFELIEIPHVRQSGKNSADIRMVVDALDLCYTKAHVNTFVIISGDSDFSPLVSKLRENAKQVIGVGVQQSTSDLLVANCDEFIFYDDLVRESRRTVAKQSNAKPAQPVAQQPAQPSAKRAGDEPKKPKEDVEARRTKAIEIAVQTFDALAAERGDSGKIWASVLKNAIKRRKPDFNESYYGFRAFGNLLEEAQARGLLEFGRDEKSGAYVYRGAAVNLGGDASNEASNEAPVETSGDTSGEAMDAADVFAPSAPSGDDSQGGNRHDSRRKGRAARKAARAENETMRDETPAPYVEDQPAPHADSHRRDTRNAPDTQRQKGSRKGRQKADRTPYPEPLIEAPISNEDSMAAAGFAPVVEAAYEPAPEAIVEEAVDIVAQETIDVTADEAPAKARRPARSSRKTAAKKVKKTPAPAIGDAPDIHAPESAADRPPVEAQAPEAVTEAATEAAPAAKKAARKTAPRSRRPRKTAATDNE